MANIPLKILVASCAAGSLPDPAKAFANSGALAGLWIPDKNRTKVPVGLFRRAWPFHLCMKPFYHCAPQIWREHMFFRFYPVWKAWFRAQSWPETNVVHSLLGFATESFAHADRIGALKVLDCPNSHPTTYRGFWQRECDLWCPGERVPLPDWMHARMNREVESADVILCPSLFVRDSMILNGIPSEKCALAPFGVDTSIFQCREAMPAHPRFVSVGTICLRKGYQYLFRAFHEVKKQMPEAELICIGNYKIDFRRERPKWEKTFTHVPHTSQAELAKLLRTCTAFVFPSQEEGLARSLIEALASGLPIIATHESGATTLIEDGVQGFIVRGRDPAHIAAAMLRAASDRALNAEMSKAAFQTGSKENTWQDYGDRLMNEFRTRLEAKRGLVPVR